MFAYNKQIILFFHSLYIYNRNGTTYIPVWIGHTYKVVPLTFVGGRKYDIVDRLDDDMKRCVDIVQSYKLRIGDGTEIRVVDRETFTIQTMTLVEL